jgi:hypothetical protein
MTEIRDEKKKERKKERTQERTKECQKERKKEQDLLGQVSRLRKREGQKYVNFYGKS